MIRTLCIATLFAVGMAASANAASVNASFTETSEGIWELHAELTPMDGDVLGLSGFDFEVVDTPAADVSWEVGDIFAITDAFQNVGFTSRVAGPVGGAGSTRFSVGAVQDPGAPDLNIPGIGMEEVVVEGPSPDDINVQVPALLGTLTTPAGLGADNFTAVNFSALSSEGGSDAVSEDNLTLSVIPFGGGGEDPIAVGDPASGSMISLQEAFRDLSGLLEGAIVVSNDGGGDLTIEDLVFENESHPGLLGGVIDGNEVDLTLDVAASQQLPPDTMVSADLTVVTNGGDLNYNLKATVPEPSTVALAGLALVGLVGYCRRK